MLKFCKKSPEWKNSKLALCSHGQWCSKKEKLTCACSGAAPSAAVERPYGVLVEWYTYTFLEAIFFFFFFLFLD